MSTTVRVDDSPFVAVIGMAGRFPGAPDIETFWRRLCAGEEMISRFPGDDPCNPESRVAFGALENADEFDAAFFRYSPNEALIIDPQQRALLECAHEALDRAGYGAEATRRSVGVFAGGSTTDYRAAVQSQLHRMPFVDDWQLRLVTAPDFLATRIAYKLALDGPAVSVQTACSTSLVAVHLAMQSLLAGDCHIALAGGAAVHVPHPRPRYTEGGILSPDGRCRAFDADAQGTVGGDAVGMVVLKPLSDALADADHIHAVLRGSAINNDGGDKVGFTAPSVSGQAKVIRAAQIIAEVPADTITYVEAHGTGTRLGDPIEVAALTRAFRESTARRGFCALGSVKTNIGHTDAAAGVTGLIKTVLAVEHGLLPPSLHYSRPNPEIDFAGSPFTVNDTLRTWHSPDSPRRAGVSALGVGGTNVHVIVEEPPSRAAPADDHRQQLLLLSARTPTALQAMSQRLAAHLRERPDLRLGDVAWTLQVGREEHAHRRFLVCTNREEAIRALPEGTGLSTDETFAGSAEYTGGQSPQIVFMFPGQGSQHIDMARGLYEREHSFAAVVDELCSAARPVLGFDLREVLFPTRGDESDRQHARRRLATIEVGQPAVFIVEHALATLLTKWGLVPDAVVGHSLGAYAAACHAGVLSATDAVALVARRGQLLQSLPAGTMLAVRLAEEEVAPMLPSGLSVAAVNGPSQCTVSGPVDLVTCFADELARREVDARVLPIATAGHSPLVAPIMAEFRAEVDALSLSRSRIHLLSDTTGTWTEPHDLTTGKYWADHLRSPVQFGRALTTVLARPNRILVEVGPGRTLVTLARQHPDFGTRLAVPTLPHPVDRTSDVTTVLAAVGQLWSVGVPIRWDKVHTDRPRRVILPTYPFERRRFLVELARSTGSGASDVTGKPGSPQVTKRIDAGADVVPAPAEAYGDTEIERAIGVAMAQALGLDRVQVHDDLFQLGGDSLTAARLATWARDRFGVPVTSVDVIRARTVGACARVVADRLGPVGISQ